MLRSSIKKCFLHSTSRLSYPKLYTVDHEWIEIKNGIGTIGISDYAQKALGDVVFVEVPSPNKTIKRKEVLGAIESVKAASDVYSPVSGVVIEGNLHLEKEPSLINVSPVGEGWIAKVN
jgi:glycine cleavage system H protein